MPQLARPKDAGSTPDGTPRTGRAIVTAACVLAAAMGIGRFAYTPILPLMQAQADVTGSLAASIASANYVGYLLGMIAGMVWQPAARSRTSLRVSAVALVATLAMMPLTTSPAAWLAARTVAGAASALIFLVASNAVLERATGDRAHLAGWVYGGVGAGIALSGALILTAGTGVTWRAAWLLATVAAVGLLVAAWPLGAGPAPTPPRSAEATRVPRGFVVLAVMYAVEGAGYIVAGTFLVAAFRSAGSAGLGA